MDLRQMGYDCNSAKEMLEALVNDEYCTYIVGKFENYEAILRALRPVFKIYLYIGVFFKKNRHVNIILKIWCRNQFDHIECAGMLYMKCNGKLNNLSKIR